MVKSAGNPVELDPFQRIVNVHWKSVITEYIIVSFSTDENEGSRITPVFGSFGGAGVPTIGNGSYIEGYFSSTLFDVFSGFEPDVIAAFDVDGNIIGHAEALSATVSDDLPHAVDASGLANKILYGLAIFTVGGGAPPGAAGILTRWVLDRAIITGLPPSLAASEFNELPATLEMLGNELDDGPDSYNVTFPGLPGPGDDKITGRLNTDIAGGAGTIVTFETFNVGLENVIYNGDPYTPIGWLGSVTNMNVNENPANWRYQCRFLCKKDA